MLPMSLFKNKLEDDAAIKYFQSLDNARSRSFAGKDKIDLATDMGNLLAYKEYINKEALGGAHVHVDLNDMSKVNQHHGEAAGDQAIKKFAQIATPLAKYYGGQSFRVRGDDFRFHFKHDESAHMFSRDLKRELDDNNAKGGQVGAEDMLNAGSPGFNVSASIGIGTSPETAHHGLEKAKNSLGSYSKVQDPYTKLYSGGIKRENYHPVGKSPTVIGSMIEPSEDVVSEYHPLVASRGGVL